MSLPAILLLPRNAIDTTHTGSCDVQGPHPRGQQSLTLYTSYRHQGRPGEPTSHRKKPYKSLTSREGGPEDTSGSPSYQALKPKTGMLFVRCDAAGLLAYTYWYCTDFFEGGSCWDVPVADTCPRKSFLRPVKDCRMVLPTPGLWGRNPGDRPKGRGGHL